MLSEINTRSRRRESSLFEVNRDPRLASYQSNDLMFPLGVDADDRRDNLFSMDRDEERLINPLELGGKNRYVPRIIVMFGRRGMGKTLGQTALLHLMSRRHNAAKSGHKIATNYFVDFADYYDQLILDELQSFPPWAERLTLGLDEIVDLLPSSRTMSSYNLLSISLMRQIRKRGIEVIASTQFPQELSRGMLRQVDFFIECELKNEGAGVKFYWHDWWGQYTGNARSRRYWPPPKSEADHVNILWGTDKMFGRYMTEEVIANVYSQHRGRIITDQYGDDEPQLIDIRPTFEQVIAGDVPDPPVRLTAFLEEAKKMYERPRLGVRQLEAILVANTVPVYRDPAGDAWVGVDSG